MEYSNADLRILERELESYKLDTPCLISGCTEPYCGVKGEVQYFKDKGAMSDTEEWMIKDIPKYRELQDKFTQLRKLQVKTAYAKKMNPTLLDLTSS
jgi:hypothetical protein